MQSLAIPTISLFLSVLSAGGDEWQSRDWIAFENASQAILEQENTVFKYPYHNVLAGHDYSQFARLDELKYNDLIIYDNVRYRVRKIEIVSRFDVARVLLQTQYSLTLQTCVNGTRDRLIVYAERPSRSN